MLSSFLQNQNQARVGNDAGWALMFFRENDDGSIPDTPALTIRADDYHAEIQASLPAGMEGGNYSFLIEGLTDADYRSLRQIAPSGEPRSRAIAKLYLYWRDVNSNGEGYLANAIGISELTRSTTVPPEALVAVLAVQSVSRKAGSRRYETTIQAQERVYSALSRRVWASICMNGLSAALDEVSRRAKIPVEPWLEEFAVATSDDQRRLVNEAANFEQGSTYIKELQDIAKALEDGTNQRGRGMLLIRDGTLHVGPRPIPFRPRGDRPIIKELTLASGLIEVEPIVAADSDPNVDLSQGDRTPPQPQFHLTLKGRGDLKPGDLVKVELPPDDFPNTLVSFGAATLGIAGPLIPDLGGNLDQASVLYVNSVQHRLGRTSGFVTVVTAVKVDESDPWDHHSPNGSRSPAEQPAAAADGGTRTAHAVRQVATTAANAKRLPEVGEVRRAYTSGGGAEAPPAQTLTIWQGLVAADGRPNQAHRLAIQREHPFIQGQAPYLSPFAWGKCGLVLPRYPGTRVMLVHRNGQNNDPVEIGSLWEAGHGPDSQAGDWWLTLPVDVAESERGAIADTATPQEHTGKVSQDLIDAAGNRIIEVGELTIRVGKDSLKNAGERPDRSSDQGSITIEHTKEGAKIVMKPDGSVEITAKKITFDTSQSSDGIELNAGNGPINLTAKSISLDTGSSGTVEVTANSVDVTVQTAMNVS